jgi:hypothetical protein
MTGQIAQCSCGQMRAGCDGKPDTIGAATGAFADEMPTRPSAEAGK